MDTATPLTEWNERDDEKVGSSESDDSADDEEKDNN